MHFLYASHFLHSRLLGFIFLAFLWALGSGCSTPASVAPEISLAVPVAFKQSEGAANSTRTETQRNTAVAMGTSWWEVFQDPQLNSMIASANQENTSVRAAEARLAYARATALQNASSQLPSSALHAGVSRQQGPLLNAAGQEGTLLTLGAIVSYEVDVWGHLAQTGNAADLDTESRKLLLQSVQLLAQAQVAQTYGALRALDQELVLLAQVMEANQDTRQIQSSQYSAGSISELEWERSNSEIETLAQEIAGLKRIRSEHENNLASLLGQSPSEFHLEPKAWTSILPTVRAGIPAVVLARRPDVAAAQKSVLAAQKRLGVTQNIWLPNLTLTGAAGYASPELRDLFTVSMQTLVVNVLASLPLLDGGKREAGIAMANAELQSALVTYKEQSLNALREVENQLSAVHYLQQQSDIASLALQNAQRREALTASRFRSGLISRLDWLVSKKQELQVQRKLLQINAARFQTSVSLARALGGGWD